MFGQANNQDQSQPDAAQIPDEAINSVVNDQTVAPSTWQHPGTPLNDDNSSAAPGAPAPAADQPATDPTWTTSGDTPTPDTDTPHDLIDIKQQALTQLAPLVSHLDQSPEEKFRTTMMMIQASDNQALIKDAYAAAQEIKDEKARAQALLDIVNEINYFTQQPVD